MKLLLLIAANFLAVFGYAQEKPGTWGEIEFFGYRNVNLAKLRDSLPFHEGDTFQLAAIESIGKKTRAAVEACTDRAPTDISIGCCDAQGNWTVFIGLSGKSIAFHPRPWGSARLPETALKLYDRFLQANSAAVQKGAAAEDRSQGYSLSVDPALRAIQLEMRGWAVEHETLLREVLGASSEDQHRIAAAELLGYATQSEAQIQSLVGATRDPDSLVRNNATRALMVLAEANPALAATLPAQEFVEMLESGTWTDLNKASTLLLHLTRSRNPELLTRLRAPEVKERLKEMANWRTGHSHPARYILGRLAGVDEAQLPELVRRGDLKVLDR